MARGYITLNKFSGVRLDKHPRDLEDSELALARNAWQPNKGEIALRRQVVWMPEPQYLPTDGPHPASICGFTTIEGNRFIVATYVETVSGVYRPRLGYWPLENPWTGGVFAYPWGELQTAARPTFLKYRGKLYVFNGAEHPAWLLEGIPNSRSTLNRSTFQFDSGEGVKARVAFIYRGQLVLAGLNDGGGYSGADETTIRFCQQDEIGNLLSALKAFSVDGGGGDPIVGGLEVPVVGGSSYIEPYALIFKRNSIWMLQGYLPSDTDAGNFTVSPFLREEGLIAKETIAQTPHGVIWCSGKNVWMAPYGATPTRIGDAIRPALERAPQSDDGWWHATYFNGIYRLSVPSIWAGNSSEYAPTQEWWCDLRYFPDVSWWGPMDIPSIASTVYETQPGAPDLYVVHGNSATPALCLAEQDSAGQMELSGGTSIQMELRFKEFTFGDPMLKKILEGVELYASCESAADVTVELYSDGGTDMDTATMSGQVNPSPGNGFVLGTSTLGSSTTLGEKYDTVVAYPSNGDRIVANTFQPVVKNVPTGQRSPLLKLAALGIRVRPIGRRP